MKWLRFGRRLARFDRSSVAAAGVYRVLLVRHRLTGRYSVVAYAAASASSLPDGRETWRESGLPVDAALLRAQEWVEGLGVGQTTLVSIDG
jgi:hypothetical protein